jgi:hypothetical protein
VAECGLPGDRGGVNVEIKKLIIGEVPLDRAVVFQCVVGWVYLLIGLFVITAAAVRIRRSTSTFSVWRRSSSSCFHFTGKLNSFDKVIYFGNVAAGLVAPSVFLHFCLTFPEPRKWLWKPVRVAMIYVPAAILFLLYAAFASGAMKVSLPLMEVSWVLDRVWMALATLPYSPVGSR